MEIGQSVTGTKKYEEEEKEPGSESISQKADRLGREHTQKMKAAYETLYAQIASASLPALKGSPKQIAWAETIRTTAVTVIQRNYRPYDKIPDRAVEKVSEQKLAQMRGRVSELAQVDASWWITNRARWM